MGLLSPVVIDALPRTLDEFRTLRDKAARTPQGGAAMMVAALHAFAEGAPDAGVMLVSAVDRGRLQEAVGSPLGFNLLKGDLQLISNQVKGKPHILRSYFRGATPANGYKLPPAPLALEFSSNQYCADPSTGQTKVFIACSGASTPRPVQVKVNDKGLWKAVEWSTLIVGVQALPRQQDDI